MISTVNFTVFDVTKKVSFESIHFFKYLIELSRKEGTSEDNFSLAFLAETGLPSWSHFIYEVIFGLPDHHHLRYVS